MFKLQDITKKLDITPYLTDMEWSGDMEQAGRKLAFTIAYTTMDKDKTWTNIQVELGDRVELSEVDELTQQETKIFSGVVFLRNRRSESYVMTFVAYDNLIYLAKSQICAKYTGATLRSIIQNVCGALGVMAGDLSCKDLDHTADFIADSVSGSQVIQKCLDIAHAWTGWQYNVYMSPTKDGKQVLNVVRADTVIDGYLLKDTANVTNAEHEESIEDMVNQVAIADKDGNITGYIKNQEDVQKYGLLQQVYTVNDKQNTEVAARAMLKRVAGTSSVNALGNIQCIAGYAVEIQEEQLKGKFLISSDTHRIRNGQHTMELNLTYIVPPSNSSSAK